MVISIGLEEIFYAEGAAVEGEFVARLFVQESFGEGCCGRAEEDGLAVDGMFAQAGTHENSGKRVSKKINPFPGTI